MALTTSRYAPILSPALARDPSRGRSRSRSRGRDAGRISDKQIATAGAAIGVAGAALGAYHGYRRDNSVGWAIWWSLMGAAFPIVTIPVALAQGFGQPKGV